MINRQDRLLHFSTETVYYDVYTVHKVLYHQMGLNEKNVCICQPHCEDKHHSADRDKLLVEFLDMP